MTYDSFVLVGVVAALGLNSTNARAGVIGFEELQSGEIVSTQFLGSAGVTIIAFNPNQPFDLATVFDTILDDPAGPFWGAGNLPRGTVLGKTLVLAGNDIDEGGDGFLDDPTDESSRPAGSLTVDFQTPITEFGFDIIDLVVASVYGTTIDFYANDVLAGSVQLTDFMNPDSDFYDPTVFFSANSSANRLDRITAEAFGVAAFDRVTLNFGGSAAIDNIQFVAVPAPGAAVLLLASVLGPRRRRVAP